MEGRGARTDIRPREDGAQRLRHPGCMLCVERHRHIHDGEVPREEEEDRDEVPFHRPHVRDFEIERGDVLHDLWICV